MPGRHRSPTPASKTSPEVVRQLNLLCLSLAGHCVRRKEITVNNLVACESPREGLADRSAADTGFELCSRDPGVYKGPLCLACHNFT